MEKMTKQKAEWIYKAMHDIRNFEDEVHRIFTSGEIPGFVHLYAGQEAVATGVCAHLTDSDYITSTHRGHGHCIAKGCDLNGMMAEIFGKETGLCKGKGGSMHIADIDKGMLGANGMVGGGFPIAVGAGLRNKYLKTDDVAICFFGDGASNEGTFHEGINMAAIWDLPVVFVCENNSFAEATPMTYSCGSKTIAERSVAYGIPGVRVNGKDLVEVYEAAGEAIARARRGEGPTLIECVTYRNYGHFEGDEQKYKAKEGDEKEFADFENIIHFREVAIKNKWLTEKKAKEIEEQSRQDTEAAVQFARESSVPKPEALFEDVSI
ncbi:thiamine pyrophosphate-dependent dehydrogenase E1 component subunit alpha [Vagococcus lutrae]|uniref:thiamine pyrophosphate-dependent dehydrogenase E1 component subunit alpha n=1 Tax=Vagococcus lutrae TaxID=81947 RepID=UPI00200F3784|nr:thiamine pyrophosphate-dependent dehydrogenase E1 component subunit alpha [Vagococcus lutrae]MCO7151342.1 thiamine pyrophosphate-dependent dehydrogenase E1 component subunit alpha [Vagococcus lutrae]MDT2806844.1 thiamine pyrophosphate-dependent dehydrogenase E1 component subunit alpha [Vagococcus lutrae]MDT2813027.1 thiamine pyrophosphate-dependent dehydrogenase E1 component subunit alpha [Vagococcus lutrae]MDT2820062.1 thiamine pyrophosphate-dependent dehydrogenase E1 component subunit alph